MVCLKLSDILIYNIMVFVLLLFFSLSGCDLTEERQTEKRVPFHTLCIKGENQCNAPSISRVYLLEA